MNKPNEVDKNLKKYYPHILKCVRCSLEYGANSPNGNKLCPVCIGELRINRSQFKPYSKSLSKALGERLKQSEGANEDER